MILYYLSYLIEKERQMGKLLIVKLVQIKHNSQSASFEIAEFQEF